MDSDSAPPLWPFLADFGLRGSLTDGPSLRVNQLRTARPRQLEDVLGAAARQCGSDLWVPRHSWGASRRVLETTVPSTLAEILFLWLWDERDLKCLKTPLRSGLAGLALASQRVPVASEAAPREAGLAAQAFRGSAQAPSEPLVDGLSWHRGYPLRRADLGPLASDPPPLIQPPRLNWFP